MVSGSDPQESALMEGTLFCTGGGGSVCLHFFHLSKACLCI